MDFSKQLLGRVYLVCFHAQVTPASAKAVVETLPDARAKAGRPLLFVILVQDGLQPPTAEARDYIMKATKQMMESCESIHNLHEGTSVGATVYRSLIRAMITMGGFRGQVFVHESFEAFTKQYATALGAPEAEVIAAANKMRGR